MAEGWILEGWLRIGLRRQPHDTTERRQESTSDETHPMALTPCHRRSHRQAMADLDWTPEFGLVDGLRDSYEKDFGRGNFRKAADFTTDDMVLEKVKGLVKA